MLCSPVAQKESRQGKPGSPGTGLAAQHSYYSTAASIEGNIRCTTQRLSLHASVIMFATQAGMAKPISKPQAQCTRMALLIKPAPPILLKCGASKDCLVRIWCCEACLQRVYCAPKTWVSTLLAFCCMSTATSTRCAMLSDMLDSCL